MLHSFLLLWTFLDISYRLLFKCSWATIMCQFSNIINEVDIFLKMPLTELKPSERTGERSKLGLIQGDGTGREQGKEEAARSHSGGKVSIGDQNNSTSRSSTAISADCTLPLPCSASVEVQKPDLGNNGQLEVTAEKRGEDMQCEALVSQELKCKSAGLKLKHFLCPPLSHRCKKALVLFR